MNSAEELAALECSVPLTAEVREKIAAAEKATLPMLQFWVLWCTDAPQEVKKKIEEQSGKLPPGWTYEEHHAQT